MKFYLPFPSDLTFCKFYTLHHFIFSLLIKIVIYHSHKVYKTFSRYFGTFFSQGFLFFSLKKKKKSKLLNYLAAASRTMFIPARSLSPPHLLLAIMWQIGSRF